MKGYIYKITNLVTSDFYIGQTRFDERRKKDHFSRLRKGNHFNIRLQNSFNKHGEENFIFEILESYLFPENYSCECVKEYLSCMEIFYILELNPKYNLSRVNQESRLGHNLSEEHKEKIRKAHLGRALSEEHRKAISLGNKGKISPTKGVKKTREEVEKSVMNRKEKAEERGYWFTEEHINNIQKAKKGYTHSEETKKKISKNRKGISICEEGNEKKKKSLRIRYHKEFDVFLEGMYVGTFGNHQDAIEQLNLRSSSMLSACLSGKYKKYKGYIFKYKEEVDNG